MSRIILCRYCHGVVCGTRFPEHADWMNAPEIREARIESLADYYAPCTRCKEFPGFAPCAFGWVYV